MINPINATELTALVQRDYRNAAKYAQLQASEVKAKKLAFRLTQPLNLLLVKLFVR